MDWWYNFYFIETSWVNHHSLLYLCHCHCSFCTDFNGLLLTLALVFIGDMTQEVTWTTDGPQHVLSLIVISHLRNPALTIHSKCMWGSHICWMAHFKTLKTSWVIAIYVLAQVARGSQVGGEGDLKERSLCLLLALIHHQSML